MNLSLQPKKFINSEHTGEYVQVSLPIGKREVETAINIHYMDEGSGEPLILVHGVGQSMFTWRKIYDKLKGYYRVISLDLAGHGFSDKPPIALYSIDEQVMIIIKLLDALEIKSAHFVAFSTGCVYATEIAKRYPDRVARIVLMSPGGVTGQMPPLVRMLATPVFGNVASALFLGIGKIRGMLEECFLDLTLVTDDVVEAYATPLLEPAVKRAVRLSLAAYDDSVATADIRKIENPVLILLGSDDKWHSTEIAELYHAALKNGNFAIIRNAGHLLHEEKPEKVVSAVLEYIPVPIPSAEDDETN